MILALQDQISTPLQRRKSREREGYGDGIFTSQKQSAKHTKERALLFFIRWFRRGIVPEKTTFLLFPICLGRKPNTHTIFLIKKGVCKNIERTGM